MAFKCNYFLIENRVGTVDLCKEEKKTNCYFISEI